MKKELWFMGAGGHAHVVYSALRERDNFAGCFVSKSSEEAKFYENPIYREEPIDEGAFYHIPIGNNRSRQKLAQSYAHFTYHTIIHPSAIVDRTAEIAPGAFIGPGAIINPHAFIGAHAIINSGVIIEHHNKIGAFAHVCPGSVLAGTVSIGEGVLVGANSTIIPNCSIGDWTVIGAGSTVLTDLGSDLLCVGSPCREKSRGSI